MSSKIPEGQLARRLLRSRWWFQSWTNSTTSWWRSSA